MKKADIKLLNEVINCQSAPYYKNELADWYIENLEKDVSACGKDILGNVAASLLESVSASKLMLCSTFSSTEVEFRDKRIGRDTLVLNSNFYNLGCFIIFSAMQKLIKSNKVGKLPLKVFGVISPALDDSFTSTSVAVQKIQPGSCIVVKPFVVSSRVAVNEGPIITKDPWSNRVLRNTLLDVVQGNKIPIKNTTPEYLGDTKNISTQAGGVASTLLYVPGKYSHKHSGVVVSLKTISKTIDLIYHTCLRIPGIQSFVL